MSEDPDFDMEVVEDDELDELGADGALSPKEDFRSEASREESDTGTNETDDAESISSRTGSLASDSDREVFGLGSVPEEWNISSLPSVVEIEMGSSPPSSTYNEQEEGLPFYQGNADFGHMRPKVSTWCSDPVKTADKDDVLISIRAPVGDLNIADEHCCIGRGLAALRPKEVNGLYLFYGLAQRSRWLSRLASGSTFKSVSSADLEKVDLPIPPLPEQRKIASVLSAVDQAIQKTEAIIEQAQRVKRGLMLDLLTQGMKDRPSKRVRVGPKEFSIPQNWSLVSLEEVTSKITDGTHESPSKKDEGYPLITAKHVTGGEIDYGSSYLISEEAHEKVIQRSNPEKGDILFTHIGTLGEVARVKEEKEFSIKNVALFKPDRDKILPEYLEYCLQGELVQNFIDRLSQGGVQSFLSLTLFRQFEVPLPPLEEQAEIVEVLNSVDKEIRGSKEQKERLQRLKKGLMQDLLTGEVPTADKAVKVLDEVKAHG